MTGSGVFGSDVFSGGKRPLSRYWWKTSALGDALSGSPRPAPFERTTIAWCSGTSSGVSEFPRRPERRLRHRLDLREERAVAPVRRHRRLELVQRVRQVRALLVRHPLRVFDDLHVVEEHQVHQVVRLHRLDELVRDGARVAEAAAHPARRVDRDEPRRADVRLVLRLAPLRLVDEPGERVLARDLHEQVSVRLREREGVPERPRLLERRCSSSRASPRR